MDLAFAKLMSWSMASVQITAFSEALITEVRASGSIMEISVHKTPIFKSAWCFSCKTTREALTNVPFYCSAKIKR